MTQLLTADRTKRALITESEGERQAAINVAEGNKQSSILEAEGARESSILRAEGSRQAQILEAEGFAIGLQRIFETAQGVDSKTMGLQYLDMMKQLGAGESTKWIIPMDLASIAGGADRHAVRPGGHGRQRRRLRGRQLAPECLGARARGLRDNPRPLCGRPVPISSWSRGAPSAGHV